MITTSFISPINQQLNSLSLEDLFKVQFNVNMLIFQKLYFLHKGEQPFNYPTTLPDSYVIVEHKPLSYPVYPAPNNDSIQSNVSVKKPRRLGLWRGKVKIAPDFDEPLNEIVT